MAVAANLMPPRREKNGRKQRPRKPTSLQQLEALDREKRLKETALVRSQPHRRSLPDPASDKAHSNLGRFCDFFGLPIELYWAGEKYREAVNTWRALNHLEHIKTSDEPGDPMTPDEEAKAAQFARKYMLDCDKAMWEAGAKAYIGTRAVCIDDCSVSPDLAGKVEDGLIALARHFDMLKHQRLTKARKSAIENVRFV